MNQQKIRAFAGVFWSSWAAFMPQIAHFHGSDFLGEVGLAEMGVLGFEVVLVPEQMRHPVRYQREGRAANCTEVQQEE
jgi:hypothetical protein